MARGDRWTTYRAYCGKIAKKKSWNLGEKKGLFLDTNKQYQTWCKKKKMGNNANKS